MNETTLTIASSVLFRYTYPMQEQKGSGFLVVASYVGIAIICILSLTTFSYGFLKNTYQTTASLIKTKDFSYAYRKNDRYQPVVDIAAKYPSYPVYFISNTSDTTQAGSSWQKIQTFYLLYPRTVIDLKFGTDTTKIIELAQNKTPALVVTQFRQASFTYAEELHPHSEYYIYLFKGN